MSSQTNIYPKNQLFPMKTRPVSLTKRVEYHQWFLRIKRILGVFLLHFLALSYSYSAENWQELSPGIEYQDLAGKILAPWSHIYAFRIDLNHNKLEIISAKSLALKNASADQFAEYSQAFLSINGGFFDHNFNPLGLRINDKKLENPIKHITWWGIFYIKNNQAHISSLKNFNYDNDINFAMQSGPRLLINRHIPSLKPGEADRSALGITKNGKVIILVSTNAAMSTNRLAHLMRSSPLSCTDAINLDGGSSSQLYAHIGSFQLNVHSFSNVSDAIVVKKN